MLVSDLLILYAETEIHAGTGTGLGAVDLPIQREKITHYPIIQSTSVKGALRSSASEQLGPQNKDLIAVFGPENAEHAGALVVQEARILLFPVRALKGVFVWATSVHVLNRFVRDAGTADLDGLPNVPDPPAGDQVHVSDESLLLTNPDQGVVLEEFAYLGSPDPAVAQWATELSRLLPADACWKERLQSHLVLLPDDDFRDFVTLSTEVVTRIKRDPLKGTVAGRALFTQELLPKESVLYATVSANPPHTADTELWDNTPEVSARKVLQWVQNNVARRTQIGGDETVGHGIVNLGWGSEREE